MAGPKITVVGAGSYFFGRQVIYKMATSGLMREGTLALVDADPDILQTMTALAEKVFRKTKCGVSLLSSTDRRRVMEDSDFIVLTFSRRNTHYRGLEAEIAKKHGVTMCSADTIGPAGVFHSLREIPEVLNVAKDAARLAPDAWVINYVNPTATIGIALMRHAPEVKSFSLCDGQREPFATMLWLRLAGILPHDAETIPPNMQNKLDLRIAGVNHCTWILKFHYDGEDMLPKLRDMYQSLAKAEAEGPSRKSKGRFNMNYTLKLMEAYGAFPTLPSHTKEYVPFFQGYGVAPNVPEPIRPFDAGERQVEMDEYRKETQKYSSGRLSIKKFLDRTDTEMATDIMEAMWGNFGRTFFMNTRNRGAVTNLADDAFLELRCDVDMDGPRPHPVGEMPRGLLALQQQILDAHELTAEAAVTGDRDLLRRAMLVDPLCNNIEDAENISAELLEAERDALPKYWLRK